MSVQTSYTQYPEIGVAGQIATSNDFDALSLVNNHAVPANATQIPVGRFVAYADASGSIARLPSAITDKLIGVSIRSHEIVNESGVDIPVKTAFNAMLSGDIYVQVETAVAANDPVHVRCIAGTAPADKLGAVRATADGVNTQLFAAARFMTSAPANGIAILRIKN